MTAAERARVLRRHGFEPDGVAAILGVDVADVVASHSDPSHVIPEPSAGVPEVGGTLVVRSEDYSTYAQVDYHGGIVVNPAPDYGQPAIAVAEGGPNTFNVWGDGHLDWGDVDLAHIDVNVLRLNGGSGNPAYLYINDETGVYTGATAESWLYPGAVDLNDLTGSRYIKLRSTEGLTLDNVADDKLVSLTWEALGFGTHTGGLDTTLIAEGTGVAIITEDRLTIRTNPTSTDEKLVNYYAGGYQFSWVPDADAGTDPFYQLQKWNGAPHYQINTDGSVHWGGGTDPLDVTLARDGVGSLFLDGALTVDGVLATNQEVRLRVGGYADPTPGYGAQMKWPVGTAIAGGNIVLAEEPSDPAAPGANRGVLYSRDNGAGKTQVCVRFPTGAVQVIATEP